MKYVFIAAGVIIILFLIVLHFIPLGIEPLTEVYFENHTKLPINLFLNRSFNFSFTVHNLEYQDMNYKYNVSAFDVNGTFMKQFDSGEVKLADNKTATVYETFGFNNHFKRAEIVVNVEKDNLGITPDFMKKLWWPDPNYPKNIDIHFWVDEYVPVTITIVRGNETNQSKPL